MAQERIINRTLSEDEIKEMFGIEKVWNEAGEVFQKWGKILLPQRGRGTYWHHRWLFSPEMGKVNLAVDFYKENSSLVLIDPESGEELAGIELPKLKALWTQPQFILDRGDKQVIEFSEDMDRQEFGLRIESNGRFKMGGGISGWLKELQHASGEGQ